MPLLALNMPVVGDLTALSSSSLTRPQRTAKYGPLIDALFIIPVVRVLYHVVRALKATDKLQTMLRKSHRVCASQVLQLDKSQHNTFPSTNKGHMSACCM
ncbi:hypothetical protein J3458_000134 [Metarhizium acridum]|uniref:uncharacterized protein n=1 Tax=Metarhizium acridum TaxID=92637 RepID=UPI001C6C54A2|nr:hypothetical protein J3458_000134 [Metarhizium acridum]